MDAKLKWRQQNVEYHRQKSREHYRNNLESYQLKNALYRLRQGRKVSLELIKKLYLKIKSKDMYMRKLDKLKSQARAALGIKNIRSWMGYDDTVDLETNWKNAIAEYRRRERSAQMSQGAWRSNSVLTPREVVTHTSRHGDVFLNYHFDLTETEEEGMLREVRRAMRSAPNSEGKAYYGIVAFGGGAWRVLSTPHYTTKQQAYDEFVQRLAAHLQNYDTNAVVQEISINVIEPNTRNGSVKKFKFAYTKGHIADDGSITPFFY